uniref:Uncharacterized protein n=1 Tax=Romanomermis culicivorax TaxID=13658 RepID=A0A915I410_ROMCU
MWRKFYWTTERKWTTTTSTSTSIRPNIVIRYYWPSFIRTRMWHENVVRILIEKHEN